MPDGQGLPKVATQRWKQLKHRTLFHFEESERRFTEAIEAFKQHLEKYPKDAITHQKHIYQCTYQRAISRGRKNLFLGLCSILENQGKISLGSPADKYLRAAIAEFKAAIGKPRKDGTYPLGSIWGYLEKYYPPPEEGKRDIKQAQREEYEGLIEELRWKIGQIYLLGEAIDEEQLVEVKMLLLRLYETEKYY